MKKIVCHLFVLLLLLSMSACSDASGNTPEPAETAGMGVQLSGQTEVLPPARIGTEGTTHVSLAHRYTFESAFSEADAVLQLRVGSWLSEDAEIGITYYEADVLQSYKGNVTDSITLLQDGSSKWTLKGYPLFTAGNEIFVFLNEAQNTEYPNAYWIIGAFTTLLDVTYDENGTMYYMDRYGILGETMNLSNAAGEPVAAQLRRNAEQSDSIVREMQFQYSYMFSEADIRTLVNSLCDE